MTTPLVPPTPESNPTPVQPLSVKPLFTAPEPVTPVQSPPEVTPTRSRSLRRPLTILFAVLACGVLIFIAATQLALSPFAPCRVQAADFVSKVGGLAQTWDDSAAVAQQTPRMGLAGQIVNLQAVRRQVAELDAPTCAAKAKTELLASMDATIQGFLAFLGQKPNTTVQLGFMSAQSHMRLFSDAMAAIQGQPSQATVDAVFKTINSGLNKK